MFLGIVCEYRPPVFTENKPPTFKTDMVRHVFVNFSDTEPLTIDLSQYVEDLNNDTLVYEVETNIRPSTYTIGRYLLRQILSFKKSNFFLFSQIAVIKVNL